jgi:RimJ/RimL family protein N-acetyltransferase
MHAHQDALRVFLQRGLGLDVGPAFFIGWATEDHGIVSAIAYHNWHPDAGTVEMSGYSTRRDWADLTLVREIFGFPFDQFGARLLVARTSEHNKRVRRIFRAVGAQEYVIPELRADGEAEAIQVLHRDVWAASKFMR